LQIAREFSAFVDVNQKKLSIDIGDVCEIAQACYFTNELEYGTLLITG
jgi:hypothetical protein